MTFFWILSAIAVSLTQNLASAVIPVAFVHPTHTASQLYRTTQIFAGLQAAAQGSNVMFVHYDEPVVSTAGSATALLASLAAANTSIVLNPSWGSSSDLISAAAVAPSVIDSATPVIVSPMTLNASHLNASLFPSVLHLFPSVDVQVLAMLHHAMHSNAHCVRFGVVWEPLVGPLGDSITAALVSLDLDEPLSIAVNASALNVSAVLDQWYASSLRVPGCGVLMLSDAALISVLEAFYADPRTTRERFASTYFYGTTFSRSEQILSPTYGSDPFVNLRLVQNVNNPLSTNVTSVANFHAAYTAYLALQSPLPSTLTGGSVNQSFTALAYEGYITGRFLTSALSGVGDVSAGTALLQEVYRSKYRFVDEIAFGPFTNEPQVAGKVTGIPNACNQGGRSTFLSSAANGSLAFIEDDVSAGESGVASLTVPVTQCGASASTVLRAPLTVVVSSSPTFPVDDPVGYNDFSKVTDALIKMLMDVNSQQQSSKQRFGALRRADVAPGANLSAYVASIDQRYRPLGFAGGVVDSSPSGIPSLYQNSHVMSLQDPPLRVAGVNDHYALQLVPVLADYIHSLASFATQNASGGIRVFAMTDDAAYLDLIVRSFHTFQVAEIDGDVTLAQSDLLLARINAAFDFAAATGRPTVICLGTNNRTTFVAAYRLLLTTAQLVPSHVVANVIVTLSVNPSFISTYRASTPRLSPPTALEVVFSAYVENFWLPTSATAQLLQRLYSTSDAAVFADAARIRGCVAAMVMRYALMGFNQDTPPTGDRLIDTIYTAGTITALEFSLGPFYKGKCTDSVIGRGEVDRTCQCYKGFRKFFVMSYHDVESGTSGRTNGYFYTMKTCGVQYLPLATVTSNTGLIIAIAVPCGVAVVSAIAVLMYFATKSPRDNRRAPKDSNVPFAVVFTDIQSSTSLWGRCPPEMSESVEVHHAEIRSLITAHGGYEVKTIGDSFMVAFRDAPQAARFALGIQTTFFKREWPAVVDVTYRDLAAEAEEGKVGESEGAAAGKLPQWADDVNYPLCWNGIRVRVGLHWGVGSVKLDPVSQGYDYYGTVVNTAARVEGVGNGGQVLVTKDFFDELNSRSYDFADVEVTPLGPQPLRGLDQPVVLYQLCPQSLKGRQFNALRLDIEKEAIDSESESSAVENSSSTASLLTPEGLAERIFLTRKQDLALAHLTLRLRAFFDVLFSTSTKQYQQDLVKHLGKKWQVHLRSGKDAATVEHTSALNEVEIVSRAVLAMQSMRRKGSHAGAAGDVLSPGSAALGEPGTAYHRGSQRYSKMYLDADPFRVMNFAAQSLTSPCSVGNGLKSPNFLRSSGN